MSDFYPRGTSFGAVHVLPPPGSGITLVVGPGGPGIVTLAWTDSGDSISWEVYEGTEPGGENYVSPVASTTIPTAIIEGLLTGQTYYFTVRGANAGGFGSSSNEVSVTATTEFGAYYGFVSSTTPSGADILSLQGQVVSGFAGTYVLTQTDGQEGYPCLAFLKSFGIPNQFTSGLVYGMLMESLTIGGQDYWVFISPAETFATSLQFVVT